MHSFRRRPIDINKKLPVVRSTKEINWDEDLGTNKDGTAVAQNMEAFVVRARASRPAMRAAPKKTFLLFIFGGGFSAPRQSLPARAARSYVLRVPLLRPNRPC